MHAHKTEILIDLHCDAKDKTEFTARPKTNVPGRCLRFDLREIFKRSLDHLNIKCSCECRVR